MYLASCAPLGLFSAFIVCIENETLAAFDDLATKRGNRVPNVLAKDERKRQPGPKQASRSAALERICFF